MAHLYVVTKASMSYYYILQKGTIKVGSHTSSVAIQFTPVAQFAKRKATHVSYLFQSWLSVREFPYPVPQRLLLLINVGSGFLCLRSSFPPSLSFHLRSCNSTPKKGEAPYLLKYFSNTHTNTHTHTCCLCCSHSCWCISHLCGGKASLVEVGLIPLCREV
jgi:hypothetical protein